MKNLLYICLSILMLGSFTSCVEDDFDIGEITTPTDLSVNIELIGATTDMPYGDGSGLVKFSASADDAMTYKYIYGDGFTDISSDGVATHGFTKNGVNDYTVTVVATGTGGVAANATTTVTVFSDFSDPETKQKLTGGSTKTWYISASEPGHLGVGPSGPEIGDAFTFPQWYSAGPFEKSSTCFYDGEVTFSLNASDEIVYTYNNFGNTFVNASLTPNFGGSGSEDECLPVDTTGERIVSLSPASSPVPAELTTGTAINISDGGTFPYYTQSSTYEVLEITNNRMVVRTVQGDNAALAWYLILTTEKPGEEVAFESQFDTLLWEDEFDGTELDTTIWNYETGNNNGWGNGELQFYQEENITVDGGMLTITAKKESVGGFDYTSGRITTKDKQEFEYGRVDVRAKLPAGAGTWPAIWMLGADFPDTDWPDVGEIDIMEHKGSEEGVIHGTLHYPENFAGNAVTETTTVSDVTTEFHIYTVEWTAEHIIFLVDNEVYHEFENNAGLPFNDPFFAILNVAMGGTFGGDVDPDFTEASMEVDYIKVYQ